MDSDLYSLGVTTGVTTSLRVLMMNASREGLITYIKSTITNLRETADELQNSSPSMTKVYQEALEELLSYLDTFEQYQASIDSLTKEHERQVASFEAKIHATKVTKHLKKEDKEDVLILLRSTLAEIQSSHDEEKHAKNEDYEKTAALAKEAIIRALAVLSIRQETAILEKAIRGTVEQELVQRLRQATATTLLEDGIRVWVSRQNEMFVMMTQCIMYVDGHHLVFTPTKLCFAPKLLKDLKDRYQLHHTAIDLSKDDIIINMLGVDEIKFIQRKAAVPGACDHTTSHWELPVHRNCVYIRSGRKEYFLADRKNELCGRVWGSIQGAPNRSSSLLCDKLTQLWTDVKNSPRPKFR